MTKLFVRNIEYQARAIELRALFEEYGELVQCDIAVDKDTGESRGFGFIEFANEESAARAIGALDGFVWYGRKLYVQESRPKPQRLVYE